MSQLLKLELGNGNYTYARVEEFDIFSGTQTLGGVEFTFNFSIKGTSKAQEFNLSVLTPLVDVSLFDGTNVLYVGRLRDNLTQPPRSIEYERNFQQKLEISQDAYWKLIDLTHNKDLELDFKVQLNAFVENNKGREIIVLEGSKRGTIPHSEWLKILNRGIFDKFEVITFRKTLPPFGKHTDIYHEALRKLNEAHNCFNRGDWNSVGAQCRAAWRVVKTLIPKRQQLQAIELLLASVTGDPRRKEFGDAVVKGVNNVLNKATHLEGDSSTQVPPTDLQREDALLCLHWTAATISYIASVYK